jgi:hypothetical protein
LTHTVYISGKAYGAAIEASEISKESNLPKPTVRSIGKGKQYTYELTEDQARDLLWHFDTLADCWQGGVDEYTQAEGRECRKMADRIRKLLGEVR